MNCSICEKGPLGSDPAHAALCADCERVFDWFMRVFDDGTGHCREAWITPDTTFLELSAESLECMEWLIEAEEQFGVVIADEDAERLRTVGDFVAYVRANMVGGKSPGGGRFRPSWGPDPMWDRQVDG